jgi:hypothetical protein
MSQQQREHVKCFAKALASCKAMNLGAQASRDVAARQARSRFPLSDEEQRAVAEWLAEKYPPPKQHKDGSKFPSLFDDLPAVN